MKTKKILILSICLLFIGNVNVSADNNPEEDRIPIVAKDKDNNKEIFTF